MIKLNENTPITLSLAVLVSVMGGVLWLSKVYFMAEASAISLERVSHKQEKYNEDIAELKKDVAIIKKILETKK